MWQSQIGKNKERALAMTKTVDLGAYLYKFVSMANST